VKGWGDDLVPTATHASAGACCSRWRSSSHSSTALQVAGPRTPPSPPLTRCYAQPPGAAQLHTCPPPSGVRGCQRTMPDAKGICSARMEQAAHNRVSHLTYATLTARRRGGGAAQAAGLPVLLHGGPRRMGYVCGSAEGCGAPSCPPPCGGASVERNGVRVSTRSGSPCA
jgi:hypothetical protein